MDGPDKKNQDGPLLLTDSELTQMEGLSSDKSSTLGLYLTLDNKEWNKLTGLARLLGKHAGYKCRPIASRIWGYVEDNIYENDWIAFKELLEAEIAEQPERMFDICEWFQQDEDYKDKATQGFDLESEIKDILCIEPLEPPEIVPRIIELCTRLSSIDDPEIQEALLEAYLEQYHEWSFSPSK